MTNRKRDTQDKDDDPDPQPTGKRRLEESLRQRAHKLIRLSESSNLSEAKSATQRLQELAEREGMDVVTLTQEAKEEDIDMEFERVLTENPPAEFEEIEIRVANRLQTAAGMAGAERLGLGLADADSKSKALRPVGTKKYMDYYATRLSERHLEEAGNSSPESTSAVGCPLLCSPECEPLTLRGLIAQADADSLARWEAVSLGSREVSTVATSELLKQEIANVYANIRPQGILPLIPEQAIFHAFHAILNPGDTVVIQWPIYQPLHELPRVIGCRVLLWKASEREDGSLYYDMRLLDALMGASSPAFNPKMLVVNFPSDPIGALPTRAEFDDMIVTCRKYGAYLFSDESSRGLEFEEARRLPAATDQYDLAISFSSLNVPYGLAALRTGWLASQNYAILEKIAILKDYTSPATSSVTEVLALMALRARNQILDANTAILRNNLEKARAFFRRHSSLYQWNEPLAGPVAFPRLKPCLKSAVFRDSADYFIHLADTQDIVLLPDVAFGYKDGLRFRIGLGHKNFGSLLSKWERVIDVLGPELGCIVPLD